MFIKPKTALGSMICYCNLCPKLYIRFSFSSSTSNRFCIKSLEINRFKSHLNCWDFRKFPVVNSLKRFYHTTYQILQKMPLKENESASHASETVSNTNSKENTTVSSDRKKTLKQAFRDYGATVIVFHACLSLSTFGLSYLAVSSGLDVVGWLGMDKSTLESRFAAGASTFVVAYAVYKVFSPLRVACTITVTPFIVRYLRRIGFIKSPSTAAAVQQKSSEKN